MHINRLRAKTRQGEILLRCALVDLTPARRWRASPPPLRQRRGGRAERSEAGGEVHASTSNEGLTTFARTPSTPHPWHQRASAATMVSKIAH